jgi:uncharacterized coiled-coil protein SlyX
VKLRPPRRLTSKRSRQGTLEARLTELEAEMQEQRRLSLRIAELTDVVQELLLPVAQRDEAMLKERLERYSASL